MAQAGALDLRSPLSLRSLLPDLSALGGAAEGDVADPALFWREIPAILEAICRRGEAREAIGRARCAATARAAAVRARRPANLAVVREAAVEDLSLEELREALLAALVKGELRDFLMRVAQCAGAKEVPARAAVPDLDPLRLSEQVGELVGGAVVYYRGRFLGRQADRYFGLLRPGGAAGIPWERRTITVYGNPNAREGHDTAYFGDPGTSYKYAGKEHTPLPWSADTTGVLEELRWIACVVGGQEYNFCLLNLYAPKDSIGKHADDETDLVRGSSIFSVSLGCPRVFHLEPKVGGTRSFGLPLAHGSALVMAGATQREYKHYVESEPGRQCEAEPLRVNLTFRCVRAKAGAKAGAGARATKA